MSNIAIKGATTGTGVFTIESPATNTDRTLTLPDEAGTVLTSASTVVYPKGGPAFSAYQATSQTPTTFTWTKVTIDAEVFDTNSCFDTSLSRFQPTVSGYYQISCAVRFPASTSRLLIRLAKNGNLNVQLQDLTDLYATSGSTLVYLNGTDYIEFYVFTGNSTVTSANMIDTWFNGALVRAA